MCRTYNEDYNRGYEEGLYEAWTLAREIMNTPYDEIKETYGSIHAAFKLTPQEALRRKNENTNRCAGV